MKKEYYARGKLLLFGEYAVLDGAKALVLPTKFGQKMIITKSRGSDLIWKAYESDGKEWFASQVSLYDFSPLQTSDNTTSQKLKKILKNSVRLNSEFLSNWNGIKIETHLDFPRFWGIGSSATLFKLVADWAEINALQLYYLTEIGSGCDVACSMVNSAIVFQSLDDEIEYTSFQFNPEFTKNLYFVYLESKQNSREAVKSYFSKGKNRKSTANSITKITESILACMNLKDFEQLILDHEKLIAKAIGVQPIGESQFADYWGTIKSLGAWGGDFVLATSKESFQNTQNYFKNKGLNVVIPYNEMIHM